MEGYEKGETCNRKGCCSCHINPPCGYCTTPSEEEQQAFEKIAYENFKRDIEHYAEEARKRPMLTPRELQLLKLCATEMPYKQIADTMDVSLRTVDGHRENLFKKTGARSRVGLVVWGIKNGMIKI